MTSLATSHGPTSTPLRTSDRGAGTRQPPCAQASHISSHEASKATDSPAMTRSVSLSGEPWRNSRDSASTKAAAERCETATPFGVPVEPGGEDDPGVVRGLGELGLAGHGVAVALCEMTSSLPITAATSASANTSRARSSGSSASTGTYAAPAIRTPMIAT